MSAAFIDFESGTAKEKARQELREAREQLLAQAEKRFHQRQEKEAQRILRGEDDWMLPSVARKLEKNASALSAEAKKPKKSKKEKKSKKAKKEKKAKSKKRKKNNSSDDSDSSSSGSEEEARSRSRHKKRKEKRRKHSSSSKSSDSDSEADEWVESQPKSASAPKPSPAASANETSKGQRDDWMSGILIPTFSKPVQEKNKDDRKNIDSYDPAKSSRELNPFWKNGGGGLPSASFQKPNEDSDDERSRNDHRSKKYTSSSASTSRGNWRKSKPETSDNPRDSDRRRLASPQQNKQHRQSKSSDDSRSRSPSPTPAPKVVSSTETIKQNTRDFLTDQQMNDLGAKVLKAEIMGNNELAVTLRARLDTARTQRDARKTELIADARARATGSAAAACSKDTAPEDVLLTTTSGRGFSKPLQKRSSASTAPPDPWGGRSAGKKSKKSVPTHEDGERMRFFADDDKYDIKQMVSSLTIFVYDQLLIIFRARNSSKTKSSPAVTTRMPNLPI